MATNFPTSLDTNPGDPSPSETLKAGGHANLHTFVQDAMIAVQTYIGIIGSGVTTSLTYLLTNVASIDPGHKHTFGSINGTVPVNRGGTNQTSYTKGDLLAASAATVLTKLGIGTDNMVLTADSTQATGMKWATAPGELLYGDGSDGDVTVSSPITLSRDMYYNNLVLNSTITTANFRVFVKGTLSGTGTFQQDGAAGNNGGNASGSTAGTGGTATSGITGYVTSTGGTAGGAGINGAGSGGAAGGNSSAVTNSIGVVGVGGGTGGNGGNAGGNGFGAGSVGSVTASVVKFAVMAFLTYCLLDIGSTGALIKVTSHSGSTGGGGGGQDAGGGTAGGGGGSAGGTGGWVMVFANTISGTITMRARGGVGGTGGTGANNSPTNTRAGAGGGGGAGGDGGIALAVYAHKTGTITYDLIGGTGGTGGASGGFGGAGNGTTGTTGTAGTSFELNGFNLTR